MNIKVSFFGKKLKAQLTLEWFYTLMFSDVNLKAGLLRITSRTDGARMWFYISVIHHMRFEVSFSNE